MVASLKAEAKRLTSSKARADADATIVDLLAFIDKLSRGSPASSQRGIAQVGKHVCHACVWSCVCL